MKRIFIIVFLFGLVFSNPSYAATVSGQSAVYKVTLTDVQVYDGSSWTSVTTPNQEMDIASGSVNAIIGTVISSATIPTGTYTGFSTTVSATFTVKGFVDSGTTRYYTTSSDTKSMDASSWNPNSLPPDYDERALSVSGYTEITMAATGQSIVIRPGSSISIAFSFNTTNTIALNGTDIEINEAPGITFTATIDNTTYGPVTMIQQ